MKEKVPALILLSVVVRSLISGITGPQALSIIGLSALVLGYHYIESKKETPVNEKVKTEITAMREEMGVIRSKLDAIKLTTGLRR